MHNTFRPKSFISFFDSMPNKIRFSKKAPPNAKQPNAKDQRKRRRRRRRKRKKEKKIDFFCLRFDSSVVYPTTHPWARRRPNQPKNKMWCKLYSSEMLVNHSLGAIRCGCFESVNEVSTGNLCGKIQWKCQFANGKEWKWLECCGNCVRACVSNAMQVHRPRPISNARTRRDSFGNCIRITHHHHTQQQQQERLLQRRVAIRKRKSNLPSFWRMHRWPLWKQSIRSMTTRYTVRPVWLMLIPIMKNAIDAKTNETIEQIHLPRFDAIWSCWRLISSFFASRLDSIHARTDGDVQHCAALLCTVLAFSPGATSLWTTFFFFFCFLLLFAARLLFRFFVFHFSIRNHFANTEFLLTLSDWNPIQMIFTQCTWVFWRNSRCAFTHFWSLWFVFFVGCCCCCACLLLFSTTLIFVKATLCCYRCTVRMINKNTPCQSQSFCGARCGCVAVAVFGFEQVCVRRESVLVRLVCGGGAWFEVNKFTLRTSAFFDFRCDFKWDREKLHFLTLSWRWIGPHSNDSSRFEILGFQNSNIELDRFSLRFHAPKWLDQLIALAPSELDSLTVPSEIWKNPFKLPNSYKLFLYFDIRKIT